MQRDVVVSHREADAQQIRTHDAPPIFQNPRRFLQQIQRRGRGLFRRPIFPEATPIGHAADVDIVRWEDRPSGARLVLGIDNGSLVDLLPSLASRASTHLGGLCAANDEVAPAAVLDRDGEQLTSVALELEQRRLLGTRVFERLDAAIVAFARAVAINPDRGTFAASRESLVDPNADMDAAAPPFAAPATCSSSDQRPRSSMAITLR